MQTFIGFQGQMMVEEPEEHVVIEGHVGNNQEGVRFKKKSIIQKKELQCFEMQNKILNL